MMNNERDERREGETHTHKTKKVTSARVSFQWWARSKATGSVSSQRCLSNQRQCILFYSLSSFWEWETSQEIVVVVAVSAVVVVVGTLAAFIFSLLLSLVEFYISYHKLTRDKLTLTQVTQSFNNSYSATYLYTVFVVVLFCYCEQRTKLALRSPVYGSRFSGCIFLSNFISTGISISSTEESNSSFKIITETITIERWTSTYARTIVNWISWYNSYC